MTFFIMFFYKEKIIYYVFFLIIKSYIYYLSFIHLYIFIYSQTEGHSMSSVLCTCNLVLKGRQDVEYKRKENSAVHQTTGLVLDWLNKIKLNLPDGQRMHQF